MAARKPFLLRIDPGVFAAIERWAADDLRSVNGQVEFLLREALRKAGRKLAPAAEAGDDADDAERDDEPPVARVGKRP